MADSTTAMHDNATCSDAQTRPVRVVVVGLASCFGCQVQLTNIERHLIDLLGQIDLRYWQLVSSDAMPDEFDVAVIEGAATTAEALETLRSVRERASVVIAMGACAVTGGIPGMVAAALSDGSAAVYGSELPEACGELVAPRAVREVIEVDGEIPCCPVDPMDFVAVLERTLRGSNRKPSTATLCGECKLNEYGCFYGRNTMCLGLVTRSGCGARCPGLGRPCNGCAGLSPDANLATARVICEGSGIDPVRFDRALEMFNATDPALRPE